MKNQTNAFILSLIITSITLLLVLEGFWLRSSYLNEYAQFRREVNLVFRSTVLEMQDSIIQKSIEPFRGDSSAARAFSHHRKRRTQLDTLRFVSEDDPVPKDIPVGRENIQIYISAPAGSDTVKPLHFRPMISKIRKDSGQKVFSFRLRTDSLKRTDIEDKFRLALASSDIHLPFEVIVMQQGLPFPGKTAALSTDWVSGISTNRYRATFTDAPVSILKKIVPQITFAAFLSSLTIVSFIFLYRSIRSQQRLVAIKNDLISNITHELKTPIATVSVALEALKNFKGIENPQLTREYLDIAQYELGRLSLLTDKVLTTSLFDEKGIKLDVDTVNLEKIINEILRSLKLVFEKREANVRFEKDGATFTVTGSSVHLTNVVYNLVDNALKYSPSRPDILLRLSSHDGNVSLAVTDHGIGIPAEFHSKVFDKFFRVPTGDVHTTKGHGLGLSYVRKVIEAHHGELSLTSTPGEGSTFSFTVPNTAP